jgi:hypothetical protein
VVGADGSGLRTVIPNGWNPYWSPDGSRIAFKLRSASRPLGELAIANADGTHVRYSDTHTPAQAGPWNPLPSAVHGNPTSTGSGLAAPLVFAIALAVVVVVLIGGRRVRGHIAAKR